MGKQDQTATTKLRIALSTGEGDKYHNSAHCMYITLVLFHIYIYIYIICVCDVCVYMCMYLNPETKNIGRWLEIYVDD